MVRLCVIVIFGVFSSFALAQTDNETGGLRGRADFQGALDLTDLVADDGLSAAEGEPESESGPESESESESESELESEPESESESEATGVSVRLKSRAPSSIRLVSLGEERPAFDGLDRLMWSGSNAAVAADLLSKVVSGKTPQSPLRASLRALPRALRPALHHIMVARSVGGTGFTEFAISTTDLRLKWLASVGASADLAVLVRQLPNDERWQEWQQWLVLHDLLTRNDDEACRIAGVNAASAVDAIWHQINAFCAAARGDEASASFALDLLQDSGVDDRNYFALMMRLLNQSAEIDIDEENISPLDLVLLDSVRLPISAQAIAKIDPSYRGSLASLRYLDDGARRLLNAQSFNHQGHQGHQGMNDVLSVWALLPRRDDVTLTESIAQFALVGSNVGSNADSVALARLITWQAVNGEKDDVAAGKVAFEALKADYNHIGHAALSLWLPLAQRGLDDLAFEAELAPFLGFGHDISRLIMSKEAEAWHEILTLSPKPLEVDILITADALDALPLLRRAEQSIAPIDWFAIKGGDRPLAGNLSLGYGDMMRLTEAANAGRKAEVLVRSIVLLQDNNLADLSRDAAGVVVGALHDVGLEATARSLARDILLSWAMERQFGATGDAPSN